MKGGAEAASSHIMLITVLVITALALTILTTQIFIPGLKTDEMVQERTLAYELSYAMNALSLEEAGEVTKKLNKESKITTGIEDGKYFVSVGKEKVFTDAKLKDIVIETGDEISIVKSFEDEYLEVKVA